MRRRKKAGPDANARARWMAQFEAHYLKLRPNLRYKIDWDSAYIYYNEGLTPARAAHRVINEVPTGEV